MFTVSCYEAQAQSQPWLLDSGYINHMTADESFFINLKKSHLSRVKVGNGKFVQVKDINTVAIKTPSIKTIHDVLFVSDIAKNLLSIRQILEKNYFL